MCMDVRVVTWLNSQGHDATHLRDEGLQRMPNGGIFEKAVEESRVVVTFDLDFGEIVALCHGKKTGVISFSSSDHSVCSCYSAPFRSDRRLCGRLESGRYRDCRREPISNQGIPMIQCS